MIRFELKLINYAALLGIAVLLAISGCRQIDAMAPVRPDRNPVQLDQSPPQTQENTDTLPSRIDSAINVIRPDIQYFKPKPDLQSAEKINLEEGDIVTLSGSLQTEVEYAYGLFSFTDNTGTKSNVALLPNAILEQMHKLSGCDKAMNFEITGEVTVYQDKVYILVTRSIILD